MTAKCVQVLEQLKAFKEYITKLARSSDEIHLSAAVALMSSESSYPFEDRDLYLLRLCEMHLMQDLKQRAEKEVIACESRSNSVDVSSEGRRFS